MSDTHAQTLRYIRAIRSSPIRARVTLYGFTQIQKFANRKDADFIAEATRRHGGTFDYLTPKNEK